MSVHLFPSLRGYQRGWLRGDLIAAVTVWAVLIPEALAYAGIAGVSPVVGLYAAPPALIFYAMLGSSRQMIAGPMSATAALSAATVGQLVAPGSGVFVAMTTTLALTAGIVALLAGMLRLGFLASYISQPVMKGIIVGLALTIIVGQLPDLLGVGQVRGQFFEKLWGVLQQLGSIAGLTALIGVGSLGLLLLLRRFAPSVPAALLVVTAGIALEKLVGIHEHGVAIVGPIQAGLPGFGLPDVTTHQFTSALTGGAAVIFVGFAEGLGAAKAYAAKRHEDIDPNQELLGIGAANLGSGLLGGMIVNGSLSKTAVNVDSGGETQLAGLVVAGLTVLTLAFLTGLFESLPLATLAAVVIAAVIELVDFPALASLFRAPTKRAIQHFGVEARADFAAAVAALAGVLVLGTLPGLFIGIAVAFLLLLYRSSQPNIAVLGQLPSGHFADVSREPTAKLVPGITVLRVESGLYFANADTVRAAIRRAARAPGTRAVVLDAESMPYIDLTAAAALEQVHDELQSAGQKLVIARDIGQVSDVLDTAMVDDGPRRVYPTVREAVADLLTNGPPGTLPLPEDSPRP